MYREVVAEPETMDALSHAIEVVVPGHLRNELDELVLVHKDAAGRIEENITSGLADHLEGERRLICPAELQVDILRLWVRHSLLWDRYYLVAEDVLAAVAAVEVGWLDQDAHPMRRLQVQLEIESLDVSTVDIALADVSFGGQIFAYVLLTASPARLSVAVKPYSV